MLEAVSVIYTRDRRKLGSAKTAVVETNRARKLYNKKSLEAGGRPPSKV